MNSRDERAPHAGAPMRSGLAVAYRAPLLVLGFLGLVAGVLAGLARLGWPVSPIAAGNAALHGPLMICAFFGVVISLERAVAIGRTVAYLGPLVCGLGGVATIAGGTGVAPWLFLAGSTVLLLATLDIFRRQRALFTFTLSLGALAWVVGNALWAAGAAPYQAVPWWLAFLILTIAGERLELSRFLPPSPMATRVFAAILVVIGAGLVGTGTGWGAPVFAASLLALSAWLLKQDIARRTVRGTGLTRYIALCLLSGYAWLAIGSSIVLCAGSLQPGTPAYDAAVHALALGFVFSMVFGHAPIIVPAVLRVSVPYGPAFYVPLTLLHLSLLVRLAGDATGSFDWTRAGGLLNAIALAAFIVNTAAAVIRGR
jgi:hypothetical protein